MQDFVYQELGLWMDRLIVMAHAAEEHFCRLSLRLEQQEKWDLAWKATGVFDFYTRLPRCLEEILETVEEENLSCGSAYQMFRFRLSVFLGQLQTEMIEGVAQGYPLDLFQSKLGVAHRFYHYAWSHYPR
jgi:hypothetical protein